MYDHSYYKSHLGSVHQMPSTKHRGKMMIRGMMVVCAILNVGFARQDPKFEGCFYSLTSESQPLTMLDTVCQITGLNE
jgi:hypothetical protein